MGCDIHFVVEGLRNADGVDKWVGEIGSSGISAWLPYKLRKEVPILNCKDRNYYFFGLLAGVRAPGPEPLGAPPDISDMAFAEIDRWGRNGHSHSYCTLREFVTKYLASMDISKAAADKLEGKDPVLEFLQADTSFQYDPDDIDLYRVVFWFDN